MAARGLRAGGAAEDLRSRSKGRADGECEDNPRRGGWSPGTDVRGDRERWKTALKEEGCRMLGAVAVLGAPSNLGEQGE